MKCFNLDSKMFKNKNQENVYLSKMKNSSFTPSQSMLVVNINQNYFIMCINDLTCLLYFIPLLQ